MEKAIYQLHIPRTSGVFVRSVLSSYSGKNNKSLLSGHNFKINIEDFKKQDYITGHYGTTPIPYAEKTFTVLRDPAKRTFSYMKYVWEKFYRQLSLDDAFNYFLTDQNFRENISNQQSKFLTADTDLENYNKNIHNMQNHVLSGWSLIAKEISKDAVLESIHNNNIEILFFEDPDLYKKVFTIFELVNRESIDYSKKINSSVEVDSYFYKKYYNEILQLNNIDIEVYNFLKEAVE